jgi:multidrug efflux pump
MGSGEYALRSLLNNKKAVGMGVFQLPGSNALAVSQAVRARMAELKTKMPEGVDYAIAYDPTVFVDKSIDAVIHTLIEAICSWCSWWSFSCKPGVRPSFRSRRCRCRSSAPLP